MKDTNYKDDPIAKNVEKKGLYRIKKIISVKPFYIKAVFQSEKTKIQEERLIDVHSAIADVLTLAKERTLFHDLLNPDYFCTVKYDGYFTIEWDNGLDMCPDVLYYYSERVLETINL